MIRIGDTFTARRRHRQGAPFVQWKVISAPAKALDGAGTLYVWAEPIYPSRGGPRVWPVAEIPKETAP